MPEILIVGDYFDKVFRSLKLRPLFFERFDNRQKFFLVNLVIVFDQNIFGRKENDKIKSPFRIILEEYIFRNLNRNVGFNDRFPIEIEKSKDRSNNKNRF